MAIMDDARKAATKKRSYADFAGSSSGSSVAMAEMPPHVQPPPPQLPPGVYFSPTPMECVELLNRWIAGDNEMPERDTWNCVRSGNIYGEIPDVLRQQHPPASIREGDPAWWFLSETRFQSQAVKRGASRRATRRVETGGYWQLEQKKEELDDDGFKNCFGYYVDGGHSSKPRKSLDKTAWLMQEFTSTNDDGAGKGGVPALYKVYVTPHATDNQLREIFGEEGVKLQANKEKKPARTTVPEEYFDRTAALLPEGSVRGVVAQDHAQAPPAAPEGLLDYYNQQEQYDEQDQYLAQYEQQQGALSMVAPPLPPPASPGLLAELAADAPPDNLGQYEQHQQDQDLAQYEQQQGPLSMVAPPLPPPASPGLLAELAADNLSMPMDDFMRMMDDNQQPAETVEGEEQIWDSLDAIVEDDVLANFNNDA